MIVAASGAVRRLLGTDRFRRGRCRRVNAVESCEVEKWGENKREIRFSYFSGQNNWRNIERSLLFGLLIN